MLCRCKYIYLFIYKTSLVLINEYQYYYAAGNLPGPDGTLITPEERIQQCSRHRSRFKRSKTPPGFWNLDFISTQDVEGQYNEQK